MKKLLLTTLTFCVLLNEQAYAMEKKDTYLRHRSANTWQQQDEYPTPQEAMAQKPEPKSNRKNAGKNRQYKPVDSVETVDSVSYYHNGIPHVKINLASSTCASSKSPEPLAEKSHPVSPTLPEPDSSLATIVAALPTVQAETDVINSVQPTASPVPALTEILAQAIAHPEDTIATIPSEIVALPAPQPKASPAPAASEQIAQSIAVSEVIRALTPNISASAAPVEKEYPISKVTKLYHMRSDHMTFALALLKHKEGTKKEIGHQVDRAIEYIDEELKKIAESKSHDSIKSIEEIIEMQKPHIANLQTLIELVKTNKIQAQEPMLSLAWKKALQNHNGLRVKRAALVCKEDMETLRKNKEIGNLILSLKYDKQDIAGDISDEEYTTLNGLFDKITFENSK